MKSQEQRPIVWNFRRCPYAMRARMALDAAEIDVEYREIKLQNKPAKMLEHSPKGTVPVLVLADGTVIDESIDVMRWALEQRDPEGWLGRDEAETAEIISWLDANDAFKPHLDRYKYEARYEDVDAASEKAACKEHMQRLDATLERTGYLVADRTTLADIALFPFVRQFHNVDKNNLDVWGCKRVQSWLGSFVESERFARIMKKRSLWVGRGRTGDRQP